MAESQAPYPYEAEQIQSIRKSLSEPRLSLYLKKSGNHIKYALSLYLYNTQIAKSFIHPLNIVEITLRNSIDQSLTQLYGNDWHKPGVFYDDVLTDAGRNTLDKAIERVGGTTDKSQIIATLTFDFWSNLLRPEYGAFWRPKLNIVFPNLPTDKNRHYIQKLVKEINKFRNRVAHHEPVLDFNINDIYAKIVELTGYICTNTTNWLKHFSTIHITLRNRPRKDTIQGFPLSQKLDPHFVSAQETTLLKDIVEQINDKTQAVVCMDDAGIPVAAFTATHITKHIAELGRTLGGLIDLNDHTASTIMATSEVQNGWCCIDDSTPFHQTIGELQKAQIRVIVGFNNNANKVSGIIMRAHRRY